jgi:tetratricopeptide (TPR) repeat protein
MTFRSYVCLALLGALAVSAGRGSADEATKKVALLVGINKYQNRNFDDLHFAERDATALATELKKLGFTTELLTGRGATRRNIEHKLDTILEGISKHDIVFISLSGHGMQVPVKGDDGQSKEVAFFCPVDAIRDDPQSLFSLNHLIDQILAKKGGKNLVVVDACRDAPQDVTRGVQGKIMTLPEETAVLFSCRAGQQSFENDKAGDGHGVFTYSLLEGLRGKAAEDNGELTWTGLVHHVEEMMHSNQVLEWLPADIGQEPVSTGNVGRTLLAKLTARTTVRTNPREGADRSLQKAKEVTLQKAKEIRTRGLEFYEKKQYDKAIEDYSLAIQLDPNYYWAYRDRGIAHLAKKEYDTAIQDYNQAIALNPKYALAYSNRGVAYRSKKQYDTAMQDYNEAIALNPRFAQAYNNRALVWVDKKQYDKAITDFDHAIGLNPRYTLAYCNRGNAFKEMEEYDKAIADYSKSISLDRNYTTAYINRADVWRRRKQYARALPDYNKALQIDPKNAKVANQVAWILATCPQKQYRDGPTAVAWARKACEVTSWREPEYIDTLAAAYARIGNFSEAVKWERKALSFARYAKEQGAGPRRRLKLYEHKQAFRTS